MSKFNPMTGKFEFEPNDLLRQPGDGPAMEPAVVSTEMTPPVASTITTDPLANLEDKGYVSPTDAQKASPGFQAAQKWLANSDTSDEVETPVKPGSVVGQDPAEILGAYRSMRTPAVETDSAEASTEPIRQKEDLLGEYQKLLQNRSDKNRTLDFLAGGNKIAQALAYGSGAKIDDGSELVNQLRKSADVPIENAKLNLDNKSQEAKLKQLQEKTDPTSELAGLQRDVVKKLATELGMTVGDLKNTSAENMNEIMRSLSYIQSNKNTAEARKEAARLQELLTREKMETTAYNREQDRTVKAEKTTNDQMQKMEKSVNDSELISKNNAINSMNDYLTKNYKVDLDSSKDNVPDIPGVGMLGGFRPDFLTSEKDKSFRKEVAGLANALLKSRSGAAVTDPEYKRFLEEAASDRFSNESDMLAGLRKMKKDIVSQNDLALNKFGPKAKEEFLSRTSLPTIQKTSGDQVQTTPGKSIVKKQYSPSRNQTKIVYSDGTEELVDGKQ